MKTAGEYVAGFLTSLVLTVDAIGFAAQRTEFGEGVAAACLAVMAVLAFRWREG